MAGAGGEGHQLTVGLQWLGSGIPELPGGKGGTGSPGNNPNETVKREKTNVSTLKDMKKTGENHFRTTFGINIGIAAILKQSQIFTGTIGTLFQILGAFIDVILAAFMPIIVPALQLLARMIPYIRKAAENIVGKTIEFGTKIWRMISGIGDLIPQRLKDWFGGKFMTVLGHLIVGVFLARMIGAHKILGRVIDAWFRKPLLTTVQAIYNVLQRMMLGQRAMMASGGALGGSMGGGRGGGIRSVMTPRAMGGMAAGGLATAALMAAPDVMQGNYKRAGFTAGGAVGGALIGGLIGSAVAPGPGTAAGAMIGSMIGATAGGAISDYLDQKSNASRQQAKSNIDFTGSSLPDTGSDSSWTF